MFRPQIRHLTNCAAPPPAKCARGLLNYHRRAGLRVPGRAQAPPFDGNTNRAKSAERAPRCDDAGFGTIEPLRALADPGTHRPADIANMHMKCYPPALKKAEYDEYE